MIVLNTTDNRRGQLWPLSIAPMMDRTDRHYRFFVRQITRHTLLYTEMKTTAAILNGDREKVLGFSPFEKPLSLQLGGDDAQELSECTRIAQDMGYNEINLNIGCPSDRVQQGHFGACLMAKPELVAEAVAAMRSAVSLPVTVKHRIGIDGMESYEDMARFVSIVAASGCDRFSVHARVAVLGGFNPKQNRTVPPLRYEDVYRLKQDFPGLAIEINGGIHSLGEAAVHLLNVDGVMIGRAAYDNPYLFATADQLFWGVESSAPTRREVLQAMLPYIEERLQLGDSLPRLLRHMQGLFSHQNGNKAWKQLLASRSYEDGATLLLQAVQLLPEEVLDLRAEATAETAAV